MNVPNKGIEAVITAFAQAWNRHDMQAPICSPSMPSS